MHDFFRGETGSEIVEDNGRHDARTPDAGAPLAHERINGDAVLPVHGDTQTLWQCARAVNPAGAQASRPHYLKGGQDICF
jgi:hypothetical protein